MTIKERLNSRGLNGNGLNNNGSEITKTDFEIITGVSLSSDMFSSNEYGTQDAAIWITEQNGEEFKIVIEIDSNEMITHSYI